MFEKDAEEYSNKAKTEWENETYYVDIYDNVYDSFKDGAEFGYNKAKEELKAEKEEIEIMTNFCKTYKKMHTEHLAKAKELLNACICKARGNVNPSWSELITEAEQFLQNIYTKSKSSDECKEPQGDWVVRTEDPL